MFKLRLLTAIILIPAVVLAILKMPSTYLAFGSGVVFACAAWEWIQMTVIRKNWIRLFLLGSFILVAISFVALGFSLQWMLWFSLIWWLIAFIGVVYFPKGIEIWKYLFIQPLVGLLMFVPAWVAFNHLHQQGPAGPIWVLLGCVLIWSTDTGAYMFGKIFGKKKLAPKVSPGKTLAGFYGALISGTAVMILFYYFLKPPMPFVYAIWLALITVLFAVLGDLVESMLKRVYDYKDSGNIIPGHGGMYDRLDSMLAAFPIYVLGLQMLLNLSIMQV